VKKSTVRRGKPKRHIQLAEPVREPPPPPPLESIPDPEVRAKVESWWESVKNMFGWS
jgi:hypothetical protein